MELKYFRLIKAIEEEGSLANSSERLFLTQSALSHQLRELEERLGFKVFHRTRNKWKLTQEGAPAYIKKNSYLNYCRNKVLKIGSGTVCGVVSLEPSTWHPPRNTLETTAQIRLIQQISRSRDPLYAIYDIITGIFRGRFSNYRGQ